MLTPCCNGDFFTVISLKNIKSDEKDFIVTQFDLIMKGKLTLIQRQLL